jgi:hypothetical protein
MSSGDARSRQPSPRHDDGYFDERIAAHRGLRDRDGRRCVLTSESSAQVSIWEKPAG